MTSDDTYGVETRFIIGLGARHPRFARVADELPISAIPYDGGLLENGADRAARERPDGPHRLQKGV
jgi:hypothetical protein